MATGTDTAQFGRPVRQAGRPVPVRAGTTARLGRALYLPTIVIAGIAAWLALWDSYPAARCSRPPRRPGGQPNQGSRDGRSRLSNRIGARAPSAR
ncbi:MAG TPA: hypothetical protein VN969_14245 [Streptosporangiaceae bacterium]|nr:hypothetical protein [Streptosporangiaceae bacterium]